MTHNFVGPLEGFKVTYVIYDPDHDTQGFVGYLPSDSSIYVVYRGSSSFDNWLSDLDATKRAYGHASCTNCEVHTGFYLAEQHVLAKVMIEVGRISNSLGYVKAKTTGHSLGAALANLTAMDLSFAGYEVSFYNFGQPRVGNKEYADFSNKTIPD